MFIYSNFISSLLRKEVNLESDYFEVFMMNPTYIPSNEDTVDSINCYILPNIPSKQVIFSIDDSSNDVLINIKPITWTGITGECGSLLIKKDNLLVANFELKRTFDHSRVTWKFDNYCLKFSIQ